jgi:endonuclease-3 related protein
LNSEENLLNLFQNLDVKYGDPIKYWPQWCTGEKSIEDREKIIIGMIMVQRTTWHNADLALKKLKQNDLLSINKIARLKSLDELTQLIHSAGFYQSKPK